MVAMASGAGTMVPSDMFIYGLGLDEVVKQYRGKNPFLSTYVNGRCPRGGHLETKANLCVVMEWDPQAHRP